MQKKFASHLIALSCVASLTVLLNACPVMAAKKVVNKYQQSEASDVKIYQANDTLPAHYTVLGNISTDNKKRFGRAMDKEDIDANLKVEAKDLGANALIVEKVTPDKTMGKAIKVPETAWLS